MRLKICAAIALMFYLGAYALAQETRSPQLKLRILVDKDVYALNEHVLVRSELTNLTQKTLCFPVPDQKCQAPEIGSLLTMGEPPNVGDYGWFFCHVDGGGKNGSELELEVKNRWIKLPPNAVYVTRSAEALATLDEAGDWELIAFYDPPQGSFDRDYAKTLQSAAKDEGCMLPTRKVLAEPKIITVVSTTK